MDPGRRRLELPPPRGEELEALSPGEAEEDVDRHRFTPVAEPAWS